MGLLLAWSPSFVTFFAFSFMAVLHPVQVSCLAEGQRRNLAPSSCKNHWKGVLIVGHVLCSLADPAQDLQGHPWLLSSWGSARKELVLLPCSSHEEFIPATLASPVH